jgi:hypothetical protein
MYALVFASVAMVIMNCDDTSANISRQYEDVMKASTSSGGVILPGGDLSLAHETGTHSTHIPVLSEYPNTDQEEAISDSNVLSRSRVEECEMCVQRLRESLGTIDGTNYSSSALVYVSTVEEEAGNVDLDVGNEGEESMLTIFEGINGSVMLNETKDMLSDAGTNFIKSVKPVRGQELLTMVEITTSFATETFENETSRIPKDTRDSLPPSQLNIQNAETKNNRSHTHPDVSGQTSSKLTRALFPEISSNPNETVHKRRNNVSGHSIALGEVPARDNATSCNQTVTKDCNPRSDLVALSSEILRLTDLAVKPAMLQRPSNTSAPILSFPDVPDGEDLHIQELGLSEGPFVFSYISSFLSWIQPYDFPVGKLRLERTRTG